MKIRILDILEETMADGPGFRTSIYCAGCGHHCPGCHNPQSWDFHGGREVSVEELLEIIKADEFANVTFSGGDPLYQVEAFTELRDPELHFRGSSNQRIIHLKPVEEDSIPGTVFVKPFK